MGHSDDDFDGADDEGGTQVAARVLPGLFASERSRAYLIVLAGSNVGEMFKLGTTVTIGRGQEADIRVVDDGVSRKHARLTVAADGVAVEDLNSRNGTYVNGEKISRHVLRDGDKIEVGSTTILKFTLHDQLEEQFQHQMFEAALRDGLTKAFNKRYIEDRLRTEVAYAARHGTPLSLLMFDIDHFKSVNDTHGHLAGDYVLATLAREVQKSIRREDVFGRSGGEEFSLLCRGIELAAAVTFGERLRAAIQAYPFDYGGKRLSITMSVGIAAMPDSRIQDASSFIALADEALYEAKRTGRNRVVVRRPG